MDLVDSNQDIKNSKLLWLITGIFLIPTLNAFKNLIGGSLKMLGVTIIPRATVLVSTDGLTVLTLLGLLIWILKKWSIKNKEATKLVTLKNFRTYGLVCLLIIIAGRTTGYFASTDLNKEIKLLDNAQRYEIRNNAVYLELADAILIQTREIILLIIFFVIVFKNKKSNSITTSTEPIT